MIKKILVNIIIILWMLHFPFVITIDKDLPERAYIGSVRSNIYHYPSCKWAKAIFSSNETWFNSVSEAKKLGYRACYVCKP